MTTQALATGKAADPINFENYAQLFDRLTAAQEELHEEACRLPFWCIVPDDQELSTLRTEVISAGRSLSGFLDASDEKYSVPTSPFIIVGLDAVTVRELRPFDNYELLRRSFPPSSRPVLESRVLRLRETLSSYHNYIMEKVRALLYSTRIHDRLMSKELDPLLIRGSLILDQANLKRFRLIFRVAGVCDDYDFDHFGAVEEAYESLDAALEETGEYRLITDPRSCVYSLLNGYVSDADIFREEMLTSSGEFLSLYLPRLSELNPRWSYPGEPLFHQEDAGPTHETSTVM